jgi:hypothetical protein
MANETIDFLIMMDETFVFNTKRSLLWSWAMEGSYKDRSGKIRDCGERSNDEFSCNEQTGDMHLPDRSVSIGGLCSMELFSCTSFNFLAEYKSIRASLFQTNSTVTNYCSFEIEEKVFWKYSNDFRHVNSDVPSANASSWVAKPFFLNDTQKYLTFLSWKHY